MWASGSKEFRSSGEPGHLVQIRAAEEKSHPSGNLLLGRNRQKPWSSWCLDTPGTIWRCLQHASPWAWAPRTLIALVFSDTLGTKRHYLRVGLSSGVGTKRAEIRAKLPWCLKHPMDDTTLLYKPLHGRGHRSATFVPSV